MKLFRHIAIGLSGLILLGIQTAAHAGLGAPGAIIVYAPAPAVTTAVPTLSEWGLMGLMFLMAVIGYRALKDKLDGKTIASVLLSGALILSSMFGDKVISQAYAIAAGFSNPQGGSYTMNGTNSNIQNSSGVPLKIISVTPNPPYTIKTSTTTCLAGVTVLIPNAACVVELNALAPPN